MPALIAITGDVGAREEKCAQCGGVIGVVDFVVQVSQLYDETKSNLPTIYVDYVHLDCDPVVKEHVKELRAARSGATGERKPS